MAGRPHSAARAQTEAERIRKARELPSEPRTIPATYSPELIPDLLNLADLGLTDAEIAAHWNITEQELRDWTEAHVEFKAAVARARTRSKAWWERSARLAMAERDTRYPAGLFSHVMRARFSEYDDKDKTTVHIDLSGLVVVSRRAPELPSEQTAAGRNVLIEQQPVRLTTSPTAGDDPAEQASPPVRPGGREEG
jgi:hypothetical protein